MKARKFEASINPFEKTIEIIKKYKDLNLEVTICHYEYKELDEWFTFIDYEFNLEYKVHFCYGYKKILSIYENNGKYESIKCKIRFEWEMK